MGVDITAVFQKRDGDRWVDVPSEYTEFRDYALYAWLGMDARRFAEITPLPVHEGAPADFELTGEVHPSTLPASVGQPWKTGEIYMGWGLGWILVDEVLAAQPPRAVHMVAVPQEDFRAWDGRQEPARAHEVSDDWRERSLQRGEAPGYYATPDDIVDATRYVVVSHLHDCGDSWRGFLDELRRLQALHGPVRMVYGFA